MSQKKLTFIDLFAWIGGIKIAFENSWFQCVFSNDFDKSCKITFDYNFNWILDNEHSMVLWDMRTIESKSIPEFDILTWWFPCQPFSIAWYKKWFSDDWRWDLFFDIIRIIKDKKPKAFLLENVKNLKNHDNWNTLKIIYDELEKLGYQVTDKVLNSMEYGNVPQTRERIYIVWFLDARAFNKFKFPEKIKLTKKISDCLEENIDEKYYYNNKTLYERIKNDIIKENTVYQWRRQYVRENKSNACPTLTANMWTWWHNVPLIRDRKWIRKLTPRECANFQWFPKNYKLPNIADSNLYKQFGNSVSIPVIQRIAENMFFSLS